MKSSSQISLLLTLIILNSSQSFTTLVNKNAFSLPIQSHCTRLFSSTKLEPSPSTTVGVLGNGYISILTAKVAATRGYSSWLVHPPDEKEKIQSLVGDIPNFTMIPSTDLELLETKLEESAALFFSVDSPDALMDDAVVKYALTEENTPKLKRVVAMSRNLNGSGMGFFVKASKLSANREVWSADPPSLVDQYRKFEEQVKTSCIARNVDWTIARAGTLKGGGGGETPEDFPGYLLPEYYKITKKDIITWQLLFDCKCRGIELSAGDTMSGPGIKAVFSATSPDDCDGDTSRCGIAEAMVRSLEVEAQGGKGIDFAVGTQEGRMGPTEEEWDVMWKAVGNGQ